RHCFVAKTAKTRESLILLRRDILRRVTEHQHPAVFHIKMCVGMIGLALRSIRGLFFGHFYSVTCKNHFAGLNRSRCGERKWYPVFLDLKRLLGFPGDKCEFVQFAEINACGELEWLKETALFA